MRVRTGNNNDEFKRWLLDIGEGKYKNKFESENGLIPIPKEMLVKNDIVDEIYGGKINKDDSTIHGKAILAPRNIDILEINDRVLQKLEGKVHHCYGIDTLSKNEDDTNGQYIPQVYMNSLTPNGMPPHDLKLKIGAIIILLRNMNIKQGLCNGTRLKVIEIKKYLLYAEIIAGAYAGKRVFIPRFELEPSKEEIPFSFSRRQFAVRVAYAVTINKGQGQSFDSVGIYLTVPVFSHGQLYVAASRAKNKEKIKFQLSENAKYNCKNKKKALKEYFKVNEEKIYTTNIVYKEVID